MPARTGRVFLDRIENGSGVLIVDGATVEVPLSLLPEGVREGTMLTLTLAEDEVATEAAREEVKSLMNDLLKRNAPG